MEWWLILLLIIGSLVFMMLTGIPVAFAFMLINFVGIYLFMGTAGFSQLILSIFNSLTVFTLAPVPFFVLMGAVIFQSGMAFRVLDILDKWLGRLPGRLSILAVAASVTFSTLTGSTMANTAMLGTLLIPEMSRRGYSKTMSLGPIVGSGGLAMIIPPSALGVILGGLAGISIAKLLIGGILPGLLMAALYISYIIIRCSLQPNLAPAYDVVSTPMSEKVASLLKHALPLVLIIFCVLGTIFIGVATPTEAAALGSFASFILAVLYGKLNFDVIKKSIITCLEVTVMAFMIIAGSMAFSQLIAFSGVTRELATLVAKLNVTPVLIVIGMQLVLLFLGTFMEQVSMMMITLPIYMPVATALGIDPVWFGILMLVSLEIGFTTPPFGLLLFIMKGVAPEGTTMADVYSAATPFILCNILALGIMIALPPIVTFLPSLIR